MRATLWETIQEQGVACTFSSCDTRWYYMPDSMSNARKVHFTSPKPAAGLPEKIRPFSTDEEGRVVMGLLADVEATYGVKTGIPLFERGYANEQSSGSGSKRVAILGGSHAKRLAGS